MKNGKLVAYALSLTLALTQITSLSLPLTKALPYTNSPLIPATEVQMETSQTPLTETITDVRTENLSDQKKLASKVSKAWRRYLDLQASSINLNVNVNLKYPSSAYPGDIKMKLSLLGGLDFKKSDNPKLDLKFDAFVNPDGMLNRMAGQLKLNQGKLFVNFTDYESEGTPVNEEIKKVMNKWWKTTLSAELMEQLAKNSFNSKNLSAAEKAYLQALRNSRFFTNIKHLDTHDVLGEKSDRYSVTFNDQALVNIFLKFRQLNKDNHSYTVSELRELRTYLKENKISVEIFIGQKSGILNKITAKIPVKSTSSYSPSGSVDIELATGNYNQSIEVNEPTDAQEIPAESFFSFI